MSMERPRTTRSDILLLYVARGVRGFGDGFAVIILPAYLTTIGFSPGQIGVVASALAASKSPRMPSSEAATWANCGECMDTPGGDIGCNEDPVRAVTESVDSRLALVLR